MAISGVSGANTSYRENWENNGGVYGNDEETEGTEGAGSTEKIWNAVFTDKKQNAVSTEDFLSLMVAQMTNQDFMNPMDDTQFVTQLAQFSSMQMMQEMANYSKTSYVMSLVGKDVTAARITVSGELLKETGPVEKVTLNNNEFGIYVNGKKFSLEQLMEIGGTSSKDDGGNKTDTVTPEEDLRRKDYLNSLIGREVTITKKGEDANGEYTYDITGVVEKVSTKGGEYRVYVNDEWHALDDIDEVGDRIYDPDEDEEIPPVDDAEKVEDNKPAEPDTPADTDPGENVNPDEVVSGSDAAEGTEPAETESEPENTDTDPVEETQEV